LLEFEFRVLKLKSFEYYLSIEFKNSSISSRHEHIQCFLLIQLKLDTLVLILETGVFKLETRVLILDTEFNITLCKYGCVVW